MPPPYCSLPSSQAPCNHSHACPLILALNRYFLQYYSNRHIHVQSTLAWHGVTQHLHCARISIRKVDARVMLSPLVFALHYTISHIECVPLIQFVSLESLIFGRMDVGVHSRFFFFGSPTWLTLWATSSAKQQHSPSLCCECDAGRSPQRRLNHSPHSGAFDRLFSSTMTVIR